MSCRLDATGNLIGRNVAENLSEKEQANVFMIGSHLDTVVNAGRFDGALGVLLGLGVAEVILESAIELPFALEVVGYSEEEGVRFNFPFIGSLGVTGKFDAGDFDRLDSGGVSMREALASFGSDPEQLAADSYQPVNGKQIVGFMEAHLEQSTHLQETEAPVGVVKTIAGQTRATIVLEGIAGHAGTVPHSRRHDALAGAASLILDIERLGQETEGLFATVGSLFASPGLSNVIPGRVELWLDLRHESDDVRLEALRQIELMVLELNETRGLAGRFHRKDHSPAVPMDSTLTQELLNSAKQCQDSTDTMVSGAGHDAMVMARFAPSCMLFVRCRDGISHNPDEFVSPEDIRIALEVMARTVIQVARNFSSRETT